MQLVCLSEMRGLVPFKASRYLLTGQLRTRRTGAKVMMYVQRCLRYIYMQCADSRAQNKSLSASAILPQELHPRCLGKKLTWV